MSKKPGRPAITITQPACPTVIPEGVNQCLAEHVEAGAIEQAAKQAFARGVEVGGRLHVARFAGAARAMFSAAEVQHFMALTSDASYRELTYSDSTGAQRQPEDVEEFARAFFGCGKRVMYERAQDLRLFGPDMLDRMQQYGLDRKDLRALRNLEQSDDGALKAALSAPEDQRLDRVLVLLEQVRAQQEKTTAEVADLKADIAAKERVGQARAKRIDELETALERRANLSDQEQEDELIAAADNAVGVACGALAPLVGVLAACGQRPRPSDRLLLVQRQSLERVIALALDIAREHGVGVDLANILEGGLDIGPGAAIEPSLRAVS